MSSPLFLHAFFLCLLFSVPAVASVDSLILTRDERDLVLKTSAESTHGHRIPGMFTEDGVQWAHLILPEKAPFLILPSHFIAAPSFQANFTSIPKNAYGNKMLGTALGDILLGGSGDQILDGLAGADLLQGGSGSDTYLFTLGSGADVIEEQGADSDKIFLGKAVTWHTIRPAVEDGDVHLSFVGSPYDHLRIKNGALGRKTVETVSFFDGHAFALKDVQKKGDNIRFMFAEGGVGKIVHPDKTAAFHVQGTEFADLLVAGGGQDILDGKAGADALYAGAGDDLLRIDVEDVFFDGGAGHDRVEIAAPDGLTLALASHNVEAVIGAEGADILDASSVKAPIHLEGKGGDDRLITGVRGGVLLGGLGDDHYVVGKESGYVTFQEEGDGADKIIINAPVALSDVQIVRKEEDLYVFISQSSAICIKGQYAPGQKDGQIEAVVFSGPEGESRDLTNLLSIPTVLPPEADLSLFPLLPTGDN